MLDDFMRGWDESMREAREYNERRREEHLRLLAEPCMKPVNVGDRILMRASMLGAGCGHQWEILELPVVEVSNYAVKVERKSAYRNEVDYFWVGRELVIDVLTTIPATVEQTP